MELHMVQCESGAGCWQTRAVGLWRMAEEQQVVVVVVKEVVAAVSFPTGTLLRGRGWRSALVAEHLVASCIGDAGQRDLTPG
jgi:hypothetical protein